MVNQNASTEAWQSLRLVIIAELLSSEPPWFEDPGLHSAVKLAAKFEDPP